MKKYILGLAMFLGLGNTDTIAQELKCEVVLNVQKLNTQERAIFDNLQKAIYDFMNTTKWTTDDFQPQERISCSIAITAMKYESNILSATAQIQYRRPIHATNYDSPILNFIDREFNFSYSPNDPIIYAENSSSATNLALMLAYYSYIILALDYDSFGKLSGNPYLDKIQFVLNGAMSFAGVEGKGWLSGDIRNRYFLSENLLSPQLNDFREGLYFYHRKAMDVFMKKPDEARTQVLEVLKKLQEINAVKPNSILMTAFLDAKADELMNLFMESDDEMRNEAANILLALDPQNTAKYRKMIKE